MQFVERNLNARRSLQTGALAIGLAALSAFSGWCEETTARRGESIGDLGLMSQKGLEAFARGENSDVWSAQDVTESFTSLSKQEQARVLRRCKDVMAKPSDAEPNHLVLCQFLALTLKR